MTALIRYEAARKALAEAHSVDEVRDIRDKAEAMRAYARVAGDVEMTNWAAEIKVRAERRAGELLAEMPMHNGDPRSHDATRLADLGIDKHDSSRWQKVASVPEPEFEAYIEQTKADGRELTSAGVRKLAKQSAPRAKAMNVGREFCTVEDLHELAGRRFATIYADPPWQYGNQGTRASQGDHYVGMSVDEICALPVLPCVADAAHLHLWTTNAFLFDARRVLEAWGFEYKSCFVWVKPQIGMGNYWRVSHEFLLLGVRGSLGFEDKSLRSWGEYRRAQHSAKPDEIRELIHRASPGPRLELFARRPAPGWVCWGNEIESNLFHAAANG